MKRKKLLSIVMTAIVLLYSLSPTAVQAQEPLDAFPEERRFKENRAERLEEIRPEVTPQEGNVNTASKTWEEYSYRKLEDGTLEITGYKGNDTELVVPAKIDGKRVTSIGEYAFSSCRSLTRIELPAGVTWIGWGAFSGCRSLTSIELPAGLTGIGSDAFSGCRSLTSIELPAGVTEIREGTFIGCSSLISIDLPAGLTEIGSDAFSGCSSLTRIELPARLTTIELAYENYAFYGCSSLMEIMVDENNPEYASQDGVLYDKGKTEVIFCPAGKTGNIVIPTSVTWIGGDAFRECSSLTGIELPVGLTGIGDDAFRECSSLTRIELPEGVTSIGFFAFEDCSSLTSIELPAGVTEIWSGAFSGCSSLMEIMVDENNPEYVSQEGVLYNKDKTEVICCPARKTGDIVIPTSVTEIGWYAFSGCSSLTSIELPAGVTKIGWYAFSGCSSLTRIELPAGVTEIGWYAFSGCSSLTRIELPAGVTSIERGAFEDCSSLTRIELPAGVTSIERGAFSGCSSLMEIIVDENNPEYASQDGVLYDKDKKLLICCPRGKTGDIVIPTSVTKIGDYAFSGCSSLMEIIVDENNPKYASQDGVLYDKDKKLLICCPRGKTGDIVIPTSVTKIGDYAFSGCSSLTSIELPVGLTDIMDYAFSGCSSLTRIELPAGVTSIGFDAFSGCSSLTSIELPVGLTDIMDYAFSGCSSLTRIELPAGVTWIGEEVFENCENLTLFVYRDSYAETYAKNEGLNYKYMKDCSHTFDTTIVKATAKKDGSITKTCTKCGKKTQKIIYAAKTVKLSKTSGTYNGKNQKPSVTVKDCKGKTLSNKKHYTVTYPKAMKNVGSYTVTIKLKGNYKGTVKNTFQIVPKGTQISKVTPKKKGFALKWKKQAVQTTGYEIVYSTNKKFTKKTTGTIVIGKNKTVSKTVSKLKAGKKYYVRIRTYKTIKLNGKSKKLYSAWSKIKTVTT